MAQPVDTVALHQPHRAGVEIGQHGLGAVTLRRKGEALGDKVERVVPADRDERVAADALGADPPQRRQQPARMMLPLGIARDLGADHAGGIAALPPAMNPTDRVPIADLDFERAGAGTIMRADGMSDDGRHGDLSRFSRTCLQIHDLSSLAWLWPREAA